MTPIKQNTMLENDILIDIKTRVEEIATSTIEINKTLARYDEKHQQVNEKINENKAQIEVLQEKTLDLKEQVSTERHKVNNLDAGIVKTLERFEKLEQDMTQGLNAARKEFGEGIDSNEDVFDEHVKRTEIVIEKLKNEIDSQKILISNKEAVAYYNKNRKAQFWAAGGFAVSVLMLLAYIIIEISKKNG